MVRMVEQQPELDQYFLLHVNGETGQLVRDGPEGLRLYYRLLRSEPKVGLVHTERVKGRQLVQTERVKGRRVVQIIIIIIINPLTARVVGAPQMIWQLVSSIFPCSPLPYRICRTPGLSVP